MLKKTWINMPLLLAILVYIIHFSNAVEPKLLITPSGRISRPTGTDHAFALTCEGEGSDPSNFQTFQWIGPDNNVVEDIEKEVSMDNPGEYVLYFKNPKIRDSGTYRCIARFDNTQDLSAEVEIKFYDGIKFENCPDKQALVKGSNGQINCKVTGTEINLSWLKDNVRFTGSDNHFLNNSGIFIKHVTDEDKGMYNVRAREHSGSVERKSIVVDILTPPTIVDLPETVKVVSGEQKTIECKANGFPDPEYEWIGPDHRDLSDLPEFKVDKNLGTLTVIAVTEKSGTYKCRATNQAGTSEKNFTITIIVKPEIKEFEMQSVVVGDIATVECRASGSPLPTLSIRKDTETEPVMNDGRNNLYQREESGIAILELRINPVRRHDDGFYYCSAENEGDRVERRAHFSVQFAPDMSETPVRVMKTWSNHPVNITCIARAIPNATITWFYEYYVIEHQERYVIYGDTSYSNLLVKPRGDFGDDREIYGNYTCRAKNPYGESDVSIMLEEAHIPSMLSQVIFSKITATTITFQFPGPEYDGGMAIRSFVVQYWEASDSLDQAITHEWSKGSPYILENLRPRTTYKFRFAAKNDVGVGEWRDEPPQQTKDESAPETPKLSTSGLDDDGISKNPTTKEIKWTIPPDNGKPIEYFEIRYFQVEKTTNEWRQVGDAADEKIRDWRNSPSFILVALRPSTHYKVEIRAHNSIGYSLPDSLIFKTADGIYKTAEEEMSLKEGTAFPIAAVIAIVVVLLLMILIVTDVTCYVRYRCGFFYILRHRSCGKSAGEKEKEIGVDDSKANKEPEHVEEKKTEVDNPAFDKEKEPLNDQGRPYKDETLSDDTPMIRSSSGSNHTRPTEFESAKNKSPKGSQSSVGKSSPV